MAKIEIKSEKIMPFGGIFSVIREFSSIESLIDSELGIRSSLIGYQYSEIMRAMMCNYLCGGDRIEDIKIYQPGIEYMPDMKLCSPDTMLRAINELAEANTTYVAESGSRYDFNVSEKLNTLMVKAAKVRGLLREGRQYILDFDLDRKSRLKSFISKFLAVPAKWVRRARGYVLNLYTDRSGYEDIFNLGFG